MEIKVKDAHYYPIGYIERARGRQRPRADILGTSIHLRDYHYPTYLHNLGPKLPSSQDTDLSSWAAEQQFHLAIYKY